MYKDNPLRLIAKTNHWQTVYSRSKELSNLKLFKNDTDFTPIQINFLQWLEIYYSLELDLAMKKPFISREVINDEMRTDAYLLVRDELDNYKKENIPSKQRKVDNNSKIPTVIFKGRK